MAVKTRSAIKAENVVDLNDNTAGNITPADLRGQLDDIIDSALFPGDPLPAGPPGSASSDNVNGMIALRAIIPTAGQIVHLNYHTTPGDYGAGQFVGTTMGGPYVDNDGTTIVGTDTSKAWLRVWDKIKAHVGWFGARCDPSLPTNPDDYAAVKKCFDLFTSGRSAGGAYGGGTISSGIVDVGPGFNFGTPLIYGGALGASFKLVGQVSFGRGGQEKSLLRYIGPRTHAAIIFYGANEWTIEDINTSPGLALSSFLITADNSYNNEGPHTTTADIVAGANVVVTPSLLPPPYNDNAGRVRYLQPGCFLGVGGQSVVGGAAAGADFEIVYISAVDTTAGTFTADFTKNHASGSRLGGGTPCSSGWVNRCRIQSASSPIWQELSVPNADQGVGTDGTGRHIWRFSVSDITGIKLGHPIRVGSLLYAEILYPLTITPGTGVTGTFDAYGQYNHPAGALVMYPTSGMSFGNRLLGTVQVDNVTFNDVFWPGSSLRAEPGGSGVQTADCCYGFRQIWGGNVKAFMFNNMFPQYVRVAFGCEQASGQYCFNGGTSAAIYEVIWWNIAATMNVQGWEDESSAMWLTGLGGSSPSQATFLGCTMQGRCPLQASETGGIIECTTDEMFQVSGQLTFIGCDLRNNRIFGVFGVTVGTLPVITVSSLTVVTSTVNPPGLTLINCTVTGYTTTNSNFIWDTPGNSSIDVIRNGTGNLTLLNCIGKVSGHVDRLPNIIPPLTAWQGTMTYDPPSLAAGTVATATTLVPVETPNPMLGVKLGDLVEASFSLDLQGATLRAWVSANDTVKFQFAYPPGSTPTPLDLGSGTVKCRVKK